MPRQDAGDRPRGRTVLFVSHNMPPYFDSATEAFCLPMAVGVAETTTHDAVQMYLESDIGGTVERRWRAQRLRPVTTSCASGPFVRREPESGRADQLSIAEPVELVVEYWAAESHGLRPTVNLQVNNDDGICLFHTNDWNDHALVATSPRPVWCGRPAESQRTSLRRAGSSSPWL